MTSNSIRPPYIPPSSQHTLITNNNASGINTVVVGTNNLSGANSLVINGPGADIILNGCSLLKTLNTMNERLMLISPDLEKLAKYESLREAYNYYKMVEALCFNEQDKK